MTSPGLSRRRSLLLGGVAAAGAAFTATAVTGAPAGAKPRNTAEGPWAVELFTSQGCNSCPPADAYLGSLAKRPDIVALSFHIDYWDYIGWKDPFASRATTDRQRAYARVLKQRYVYTPEMVIDGIGHDTGRERGKIEALLGEAQRRSPRRATPELTRGSDGRLAVRLAAFPLDGRPADVTFALYDRRHSTPVASGENQGRMLDNFNVVRRFEVLTRWDGAAANWSVDTTDLQQGQGVAVIVQRADHGPVIGCNKLEPMVSG
jgi:hypothetical protein